MIRSKKRLGGALLVVVCLVAGSARAEDARPDPMGGFRLLSEGAPLYLMLRLDGLAAILRRLGVDQRPDLAALKKQLGADPLDPAMLAPTGLDPSVPVVAQLFEPGPTGPKTGRFFHHRLVVRLADAMRFTLFLGGVSGMKSEDSDLTLKIAPPGTPLFAAGVRATVDSGPLLAILRIDGDRALVDISTTWEGKGPSAIELASRYPIKVATPWSLSSGKGARRLVTPSPAIALYADGRRVPALATALSFLAADEAQSEDQQHAHARREGPACQQLWSSAPPVFDDLAIAVEPETQTTTLRIAWGFASGKTHVPLSLPTVDDGAVDADTISRFAAATLSVRLVSLEAFRKLKRTGPLKDLQSITDGLARCAWLGGLQLAIRHWPQAIGSLLDLVGKPEKTGIMAPALDQTLGRLRNVDVLLRDVVKGEQRYAVAATFDPQARALLESLFAAAGTPEVLSFGTRKPALYTLAGADLGVGVATLETLASGQLLLVVADARETLTWAYAAATKTPQPKPALVVAHVDGAKAARILGESNDAHPGATDRTDWLKLLARLGRIDSDIATSGDTLLVTVHTALK